MTLWSVSLRDDIRRALAEDGIRKVLVGMTSADEVIEATMSDAS